VCGRSLRNGAKANSSTGIRAGVLFRGAGQHAVGSVLSAPHMWRQTQQHTAGVNVFQAR
jgi:hypothetical protein